MKEIVLSGYAILILCLVLSASPVDNTSAELVDAAPPELTTITKTVNGCRWIIFIGESSTGSVSIHTQHDRHCPKMHRFLE